MPDGILDCAGPTQMYFTDNVQREIAKTSGMRELKVVTSEENLEDLSLITTRPSMLIPNHFAAFLLAENCLLWMYGNVSTEHSYEMESWRNVYRCLNVWPISSLEAIVPTKQPSTRSANRIPMRLSFVIVNHLSPPTSGAAPTI